jgi:hypothetical protein
VTSCQLLSSAFSQNPFAGIIWDQKSPDGVALDPSFFSCCKGEGWVFRHKENGVFFCELQRRLAKLRTMLTHPDAAGWKLPLQKEESQLLSWIRFLRHQRTMQEPRGELLWKKAPLVSLAYEKKGNQPTSLLFSLALATVWQTGLSVGYLRLQGEENRHPPWLDWEETPAVCMVEQAKPMWHRQMREQTAELVHWCDRGRMPLWLELAPPPAASANLRGESNPRLQAVNQILGKAKSRNTLEWLDPHARARLERVTVVRIPS